MAWSRSSRSPYQGGMIVPGVMSASWQPSMEPPGWRQRRADLDHRAVRPVEREGAVAGCGDQVAAFVDQRVVVLAQADQVIQRGPAAVGPVLDVVQVDPAGLAAGEPAAARVAFAGRAAQ